MAALMRKGSRFGFARSLAQYLILDHDCRVVIHHARGREGVIETRILHDGRLRLDPPGLEVAVAELFGSAD